MTLIELMACLMLVGILLSSFSFYYQLHIKRSAFDSALLVLKATPIKIAENPSYPSLPATYQITYHESANTLVLLSAEMRCQSILKRQGLATVGLTNQGKVVAMSECRP